MLSFHVIIVIIIIYHYHYHYHYLLLLSLFIIIIIIIIYYHYDYHLHYLLLLLLFLPAATAIWCSCSPFGVQADILMVTDGEIPNPSKELLQDLADATEELGLEVHGLLVSSQASEAMQKLCTHLHLFKSWSVVGGESWMY
jgi:hypothetical protein